MRVILVLLAILLIPAISTSAAAGCSKAKIIETSATVGGGAFATPGAIFVNRAILAKMPPAMRSFAIAHECGHQFVGRSEDAADRWAAQEGKRQGWLTQSAVAEICAYTASWQSDAQHSSGAARCETIRAVFAGEGGKQRTQVATAKDWGYAGPGRKRKSAALKP
jgi:hypothetical protein